MNFMSPAGLSGFTRTTLRSFHSTFKQEFQNTVQSKSLVASAVQNQVVSKLDEVFTKVQSRPLPRHWAADWGQQPIEPTNGSAASSVLLSMFKNSLKPAPTESLTNEKPASPTVAKSVDISTRSTGLYIWGPVGQGKTMILDGFDQYLREELPAGTVLRCHFVHWMMAIHEALHEQQMGSDSPQPSIAETIKKMRSVDVADRPPARPPPPSNGSGDIVEQVALRIVSEGVRVVLLDEMQITTISDAMIFKRLAEILFELGVVFILTSNCPPERLYEGGLNRGRFLPFIDTLQDCCTPILLDSHRDFRGLATNELELRTPPYNTPGRPIEELKSDLLQAGGIFSSATRENVAVDVFHGRRLPLILLDESKGSGLTSFKSLCMAPTAPTDFVGLTRIVNRHLFVTDIPQLHVKDDAEACRRFINLTDVFYENGVKMYYDAAVPPLRLVDGVSQVVETYDEFFNKIMPRFADFDTFWSQIFDNGCVTYDNWLVALTHLGLQELGAIALWNSIPKTESIDKKVFKSALCHHLIYALSSNDQFYGVFDNSSIATKALIWLQGHADLKRWQACVEDAGILGGYSLSPPTVTSEVAFAVPRLISRICEMAKPPF